MTHQTRLCNRLTPDHFEERGGSGCGYGYVYNKNHDARVGWSIDTDEKYLGLMVWNTDFVSAGWSGELGTPEMIKVWQWLQKELIATGNYHADQLQVRPKTPVSQ